MPRRRGAAGVGRVGGIAAAGVLACSAQAVGDSAGERVIVTGSHIPRTEIEGALPVQIIRRDEIERSGVTTVEQLLERVPANFNPVNTPATISGAAAGLSSANLRGLGGGSTLVLLNGRRLANYAFDGESVDLNSIPLAAIDRVEVLKDGASAIYGSDAIAGVINFVLKRDYTGATLSADASLTQGGAGNGYWISGAVGTGDPARDGYNLFAAVSYQRDSALKALDREFARDLGLKELSSITFPASIVDRPGQRVLNPSLADGCAPPFSLPFRPFPYRTPACGFNVATQVDLLPAVERSSVMVRGTWQADPSWSVFGEALLGRNRIDVQTSSTRVTVLATQVGAPIYPAGGPYYPTDFTAANGLSGELVFGYRTLPLGPRRNSITADSQRYVIGAEGLAGGWDFDVAAVYSANNQANEHRGGYVYPDRIVAALRSGLINPWGPSGPEGQALLASTVYQGTPETVHGATSLINAFASRDIAMMPSGPLALALGGEVRRERLWNEWDPAWYDGDSTIDQPWGSSSHGRDVLALFAEMNLPIVKTLDAQLALRWDNYSDFGSTTNPKAALRWQPQREVLLRGSWGKGFRAPPLYSLSEPDKDVGVVAGRPDPIRCPVTGLDEDCLTVFNIHGGGNPQLQPETSTQWNLGLVLEPVRGLSFGLDYWHIVQDGVIVGLDVDNALRYHQKFADRIIRGPADPAYPGLPGPIVAVDTSPINLGTTKTSGIDVFLAWAAPPQPWGQLSIDAQGTYVRRFDTQIDGVTYVSQLGNAIYGLPVPRWRSTVSFDWNLGPWGATLANVYSGGYALEPDPAGSSLRKVGAASTWDLQARYEGFPGWQLAAGIRNLLDVDPWLWAGETFAVGDNAASPLGRTFYLRATYTFK